MKLFELSYEKGENVSSLEVLERVGEKVGLQGVHEWMYSDEGSIEVLKDDDSGKQLGVSGVPAFFIRSGNSPMLMLSGAQPVDVFVDAFSKVLKEA